MSKNNTESKTSSTSGTSITAGNKTLASKDICEILEACGKFGVRELSYESLQVKFGPAPREASDQNQNTNSSSVTEITENKHKEQTERAVEEAEVLTREEQLAYAMVENPALYEQLLRDGELEDDDNDKLDSQE